MTSKSIAAIDLFCGAGGLSLGLQQAGVDVIAGIDLDPNCAFPYERNIGAKFIEMSVRDVTADLLNSLWPTDGYRLLAGCAPCQPFSSHRRGANTQEEDNWSLLDEFARLVVETRPHFVTMENVTRLKGLEIFGRFVGTLKGAGYAVDFDTIYGPDFGLAQERRRLVMVASRVGVVRVPTGGDSGAQRPTVRSVIGDLTSLSSGESDPRDPLHRARSLSELNLKRMRASRPGGTWRDWPEELVAECHKRATGASFQSFYGRMMWDRPSPTITTQAFNFGTGRFGHPEQDRSLTLREAAMLQGFPRDYQFVAASSEPHMSVVGKLIGNAVPPHFGRAIAQVFQQRVAAL